MSNISRLSIVLLGASIMFGIGCRSKEPAASAPKATKAGEGPVLAPPQQTPAAAPQADSAGKTTENTPAPPPEAAPAPPPSDGTPAATSTAGDAAKPPVDEAAEAEKIKANFALLSNEDRAIAEKQKICPVSGEKLGTMGAPKKVSVAGHDVFICCKSCEDPLTKDPAKFLAKIGLEPKK